MNNNTAIVKELFDQYYVRLCDFAFRIVTCKETARDIAQDAFVKLLHRQDQVSVDHRAIKAYLYTTVKRTGLNVLRRRKIVNRVEQEEALLADAEYPTILQAMIHAEIIGELHHAIASLPKGCAKVCDMAFFEGKKNQEIADELGLSLNTIKTQKQRAIMLLRNKMSPQSFSFVLSFLLLP